MTIFPQRIHLIMKLPWTLLSALPVFVCLQTELIWTLRQEEFTIFLHVSRWTALLAHNQESLVYAVLSLLKEKELLFSRRSILLKENRKSPLSVDSFYILHRNASRKNHARTCTIFCPVLYFSGRRGKRHIYIFLIPVIIIFVSFICFNKCLCSVHAWNIGFNHGHGRGFKILFFRSIAPCGIIV